MKAKFFLIILFLSSSIAQYFYNPQRLTFKLLKWEEISQSNIIIPKVGPIISPNFFSSNISSYYNNYKSQDKIIINKIFPEININDKDGLRLRLYGNTIIILNKKIMIQNEFEFDSHGKYDPHFQGIERGYKNGWVGYIQHSSLTYNYVNGYFSIGRGNPYFFNLNESLLLNSNFSPSEYLLWKYDTKWFQFDWGVVLLNEMNLVNRYLSFHRYGINNNNWRFGFTEAIMVSYQYLGTEEIRYIMPANIFIETESNRGGNANLMWLFDAMYKSNDWTIYSEFLIDDFALDGQSPPQIAASFGIGKKLDKMLLNFKYTHINRWTGNYCDSLKSWLEMDVPIGSSLGSDSYKIEFDNYINFSSNFSLELFFNIIGNSEGTAEQRLKEWPEDVQCENNFGNNVPPKLSKINTYYIGGSFYYLLKNNILVNLNYNIDNNFETLWSCSVNYKF